MGVEKLVRETFLPSVLFLKRTPPPFAVGTLGMMPVKKYGLGLQNPAMAAHKKIERLQRASIELIQTVTGRSEFSTYDHIREVKEEHSELFKNHDNFN